jgi:hypothetical protein
MDKALNETLAALPDDTNVYVRDITFRDMTRLLLIVSPARPRVHQGQRQIRHQGLAVRACQEARGFRQREQADAGQVHYW